MIKLEENKSYTHHKSIEKMPLPAFIYVPLSQHLGKVCQPRVLIGDIVLRGQMIANSDSPVSSPIHSSLSGRVSSIQDWPHPVLGRCKAIVIENDGQDNSVTSTPRRQEEIDKLTPQDIRKIVFEAGIVGLGGASFPTHIKLNPPKPIDSLIINGAECEPYLTGDFRLMVEKTKEIIQGIALVARCLAVKNVYIAIEDNKPEAIEKFRNAIRNTQYSIRVLKSRYPQGGEKQLIKSVLKREVPGGLLPFDIGVVVQNVGTVFSVYEAVYLGKPLYERVVTLSGDCLKNPVNLLVRIGTTVKDIIKVCGPFKKQPKKIIFGGPMMGIAQFNLDTPVIKSTSGIIFLAETAAKETAEAACIRCGRCVEYCPLGLMPCLLSLSAEKEKWELAKAYGCLDCMECGLCTYICPQRRNIVQGIKTAKTKVQK